MLWKDEYRPVVRYDVRIPPVQGTLLSGAPTLVRGGVLIGAFDARSSEVGVWQRLIGGQPPTAFIGVSAEDATAVTPPSGRASTLVIVNDLAWRTIAVADRPERAFALVFSGERAQMLVVGAPTEDVWEEFEQRLRASGIL